MEVIPSVFTNFISNKLYIQQTLYPTNFILNYRKTSWTNHRHCRNWCSDRTRYDHWYLQKVFIRKIETLKVFNSDFQTLNSLWFQKLSLSSLATQTRWNSKNRRSRQQQPDHRRLELVQFEPRRKQRKNKPDVGLLEWYNVARKGLLIW